MNISDLLDVAKAESTALGSSVELEPAIESIRIKQKTLDDPDRPSKSWQPILIRLHEDFGSSDFSKRPVEEIRKEFASFIRNKRARFHPHTTNDPNELNPAEIWVFPPNC